MVHLQVLVAAEHEAVVGSELVRVCNGVPADLFDCEPKQRFGRYIGNHGDFNDTVSLRDLEYRDRTGSAAAPFTFAYAAEVTFIDLDLSPNNPSASLA